MIVITAHQNVQSQAVAS